jgi:hypothetical protein
MKIVRPKKPSTIPLIRISANLPTLPDTLQHRLDSVLADIYNHLVENDLVVTNGVMLADSKGRTSVLSKMDSVNVTLLFEPTGEIQGILKSGEFSKHKITFTARANWHLGPDKVENYGNGKVYTILGKRVDYDGG